MKQFGMQLAVLMLGGILLAGCQADTESPMNNVEQETQDAVETMNQHAEHSELETPEIIKGIDKVLETINKLEETLKSTPKDTKQIQELGHALEEEWDKIEKAVEKLDQEEYEFIEKSLYPLIAEAKKPMPEVERIQPLIEDTTKKLNEFKEKLS